MSAHLFGRGTSGGLTSVTIYLLKQIVQFFEAGGTRGCQPSVTRAGYENESTVRRVAQCATVLHEGCKYIDVAILCMRLPFEQLLLSLRFREYVSC